MDKAKSVLVTGATGFIGRAAVASLEQAGWVVTRGVRSPARSSENGEIHLDLKDPAAALRNYIYVNDVAYAIVFALQKRVEGTHLLAGSEVTSMSQMLQAICDTFLPGQQPEIAEGPEAISQVIEPSRYLPKTRGFREALSDIKGACQ